MSRRMEIGIFSTEDDFIAAVRRCSDLGVSIVDAFTPYPVHGLEPLLGIRRTRLPYVCFTAGAVGCLVGLWLQYWTSATDWPLNVGGKPFDSWPAFMPVVFELTILFAGLATAAALLLRSGLFPGAKPRLLFDGVTDNRFALAVQLEDASIPAERLQEVWTQHHAVSWQQKLVS